MTDVISSNPTSDPSVDISNDKKNKYASQLAYEKRRLAIDPEFRKTKQHRTQVRNKQRYNEDAEYREKVKQAQRDYRARRTQQFNAMKLLLSEKNDSAFNEIMKKLTI